MAGEGIGGALRFSEANLRKLASSPAMNIRSGSGSETGKNAKLARGELIDLTDAGSERFHSELRLIVKIINENNGVDFVRPMRARKTPIRVASNACTKAWV